MKRLAVIVLNYRRGPLTVDCLAAAEPELAGQTDRCAVVIDNGSDDDSGDLIESAIEENKWGRWAQLVRSSENLGFAGGNNLGFKSIEAENYLLLNSDARLQPDSLSNLLLALDENPQVGAVGPRLQWSDGDPQVSCFRYRSPISEFLEAAGTGVLDRLLNRYVVPIGVFDDPMEPPWVSYACIMIRRSVIDQIGPMDDRYFMYFEDIDYSRRMRQAGWRIRHIPEARVIHLRGGTSSVKAAMAARKRVPRYYYEARSRYFAKFYGGRAGLWLTNLCWLVGRSIAFVRELVGNKNRDVCEREAWDNWTNGWQPMRPPLAQGGGDL